ncbi:MAG: molybdopterin-binding protein [Planctomycetaceae bacterium]
MKAEIIAIGSELTCGARLDTNSQWLSRELEARGFTVHRHTTVADDAAAIIRIYQEAAVRSRVVLITGGLGPTLDDITRETLAEAFHQPLVEDAEALKHIQELFRSRGREMPERNHVQALRPANSISIHNAHGTAPGILMPLKDPDCLIAVMPGVPAEMKLMFQEQVVHQLPTSPIFVQRKVIRTFGYGESDAERLLGDLTARGRNPEVGITASQAVISLSVTARAASRHECDMLCDAVCRQIRQRLGAAVYGEEEAELHHVVGEQLLAEHLKVALLEGTTTGGLLGQWLTEDPAASTCIVHCQVFPDTTPAPSTAGTPDNLTAESAGRLPDWAGRMESQALALLDSHQADYVLLTSPTQLITEPSGIRRQTGSVVLLSNRLTQQQDVSMTGNLAIFRQRAARTALNLLRLDISTDSDGSL